MPTATAAARSVTASRPGIHVPENFEAVLQTGLDEVRKRMFKRPEEGKQFFRSLSMKKKDHKFQSYFGLGTVSQNRDSEAIPYDEMGLGFDWTLSTNTFRGGISIEQQLIEDEQYGVIKDRQEELTESEKLARELVLADWFNRGLGAAGAPGVCEDGMYFIDSARPNAFAQGGTWSNLESTSAITASSLFNTQLSFAKNKDERGQLAPMKMTHIIIRPDDEQTVWTILNSDQTVGNAYNDRNFQKGRFEYIVYNMLTTATAFFAAAPEGFDSSKNELMFGDRVSPNIKTWTENGGDVINQRIRSRFGIGCGRPTMWRAHTVS